MSLDISRMVAHLPRERKVAVLRAYHRQAKHDTTAFLYCFFLGTIGVHSMYLGQWRAALPRLLMGGVFVVVLAASIALSWPLAVVIGVPAALAVIALGWEILDLFQIDTQVEAHNRALIERLLAEEVSVAPAVAAARASAGMITAEDVAGAHALAQDVGSGRALSYDGTATTLAGSPDTSVPTQPGTPAAAMPLAPLVPQSDEHSALGWQDGQQRARGVAPVPWAEALDMPVAAAGATLARDLTDSHPQVERPQPIADVEDGTPIYVTFPQANATPVLTPLSRDLADAHPSERGAAPIVDIAGTGSGPAIVPQQPAGMAAGPEAPTPAPLPLVPTGRDLSDAHPLVSQVPPVADVESGWRQAVYVTLPQEDVPAAGAMTGGVAAVPAPAPPPEGGDEALVVLVPQEEGWESGPPPWSMPTQPMVGEPEPASALVPAEQYIPPTVSASEVPAAPPVWPVAPEEAPPAPPIWPVAPAEADTTQTLAELAAFGGAAGAGLAAEHLERAGPAVPTPAQPPEPPQPMKRVRVVRRIVMEDGGVVRELVAERIVPMDADSQAVAAELEAQLAHASPEEIAQLAHLPAGTDVVVRSRVESGPLPGPLKKPEEPPAPGS